MNRIPVLPQGYLAGLPPACLVLDKGGIGFVGHLTPRQELGGVVEEAGRGELVVLMLTTASQLNML